MRYFYLSDQIWIDEEKDNPDHCYRLWFGVNGTWKPDFPNEIIIVGDNPQTAELPKNWTIV